MSDYGEGEFSGSSGHRLHTGLRWADPEPKPFSGRAGGSLYSHLVRMHTPSEYVFTASDSQPERGRRLVALTFKAYGPWPLTTLPLGPAAPPPPDRAGESTCRSIHTSDSCRPPRCFPSQPERGSRIIALLTFDTY